MRVLEAGVKKLRMIVLVTSCALLGSTQQGCLSPTGSCLEGGVGCLADNQCCSDVCIRDVSLTGPDIGGNCKT